MSVVPIETLQQHLGDLVKSLISLPAEEKKHFRIPITYIMERLLKRYGYDAVITLVPEQDQKFINHVSSHFLWYFISEIRKQQRRRERKKKEKKMTDTGSAPKNKDEDENILMGESSEEEQEYEEIQVFFNREVLTMCRPNTGLIS